MMTKWQAALRIIRTRLWCREIGAAAAFLSALVLPGWLEATESSGIGQGTFTADEMRTILTLSPLDQAWAADPTNRYDGQPAAIELGKLLFFEPRLSKGGRHSCASCHQAIRGWADGTPKTTLEVTMPRHTPSLWNVAFNRWFYWDGRADSLWAQSLGPIESAAEMANSRANVVRLLMRDDMLHKAYLRVFGDFPEVLDPVQLPAAAMPGPAGSENPAHKAWAELTEQERLGINRVFVNVGKAIAAFEATIMSTDSPFDRFVAGIRTGARNQAGALSESAKRGLKLFVGQAKCVSCHSGPTFSDLEFHNVFLPADGKTPDNDRGRYDGIALVRESEFSARSAYNDAATGKYSEWVSYIRRTVENRRQFKTPMLRNVAKTAPYMHTGQLQTLLEAVDHCGSMDDAMSEDEHSEVIQSSVELTGTDKDDLLAFLESLTDESYFQTFTPP